MLKQRTKRLPKGCHSDTVFFMFTDKQIQGLKPKDKKYIIREGRGFAIQIRPSGTKTFLYIYEQENVRKYTKIGDYPYISLAEARKKYMELYVAHKNGELLNGSIKDYSINTWAETYLNEYSKENHSLAWQATVRQLIKKIGKEIGNEDVRTFKRSDAIRHVEMYKDRQGQARNVLKVMRGIFEYAVDREVLESNPYTRITKAIPSIKDKARDRTLSDAEIVQLWDILDDNEPIHVALKLILLTGQRPGEVANMLLADINDNWWTIRDTKNGQESRVYLTPFTKKYVQDISVKRNSISQIVSRSKYWGMDRWTPHDLRRTARTLMARVGVSDEVGEIIMNHKKIGIIRVYNRYTYDPEKKQAMELYTTELLRILGVS